MCFAHMFVLDTIVEVLFAIIAKVRRIQVPIKKLRIVTFCMEIVVFV